MTRHSHARTHRPHAHPDVPRRYEGYPSRLVAALWTESTSRDEETRIAENTARTSALAVLEEQERARETDRALLYDTMITNLTPAQRADWGMVQEITMGKIVDHIMHGTALERAVTPDEQALLEMLVVQYRAAQETAPDTTITLTITDAFDALIYRNLVKGIALDIVQTLDTLHTITGVSMRESLPVPHTPSSTHPLMITIASS